MPYKVEWKNSGAYRVYWGIVTGKDILQDNLVFYGDERLDDIRYVLVDFLGVESLSITEQDVKKLAYMDRAAANSNPNIKVAIVAMDKFIRSMSEVYTHYSELSSWEVNLFETIEEAEKWLGI